MSLLSFDVSEVLLVVPFCKVRLFPESQSTLIVVFIVGIEFSHEIVFEVILNFKDFIIM